MILELACASVRSATLPGSPSSFVQPRRKRASVCEPIPVSRSSIWTRVFWIARPITGCPSSRSTSATGFKTLLLPAPAMPWIAIVRSFDVRISSAAANCPSLSRNPCPVAAAAWTDAAAFCGSIAGELLPFPAATSDKIRCSVTTASRDASQPLCSPLPEIRSPERTKALVRFSTSAIVAGSPKSSAAL